MEIYFLIPFKLEYEDHKCLTCEEDKEVVVFLKSS